MSNKPHDAGSHEQKMSPAVKRVIDEADKRAADKAAMPAQCPTPTECRRSACHGGCLPPSSAAHGSPAPTDAALRAAPKQAEPSEPVEFYNPWRESLENCISGNKYLRASEYRYLIEELDDLYRLRAQIEQIGGGR
jgi:hypothetical protein